VSYSTSFPGTANPLREAVAGLNVWLDGAADATSWTDCQTGALAGGGNGAFGTQVPGGFDDSTGIINPAYQQFSPDQEVTIVLSSSGSPNAREVEIRLRSQLDLAPTGGNNRGYEIDLLDSNQISLVIWLGALGSFAFLGGFNGFSTAGMDMADGTIWYASFIGTVITVKCTPISTGITTTILTYDTANDDVIWTRGQPGIGFFANSGATASNTFGIKSFVANSLGDTTVPRVVQSAYIHDDTTTLGTIANTLSGVAPGSVLIAHVGWDNSNGATCTTSDGSNYTSNPEGKIVDTTDTEASQLFRLENAAQGSHLITATFSVAATARRMRIYEVSGVRTSGAFDQGAGLFQSSPGTGADGVSSSATSATANPNDIVLGFSQDSGELEPGTGTLSAGTGFTLCGPANLILAAEQKNVSSTGAQTATFTQNTNHARVTHVLALKRSLDSNFSPAGVKYDYSGFPKQMLANRFQGVQA
jgi:hypothetical protein